MLECDPLHFGRQTANTTLNIVFQEKQAPEIFEATAKKSDRPPGWSATHPGQNPKDVRARIQEGEEEYQDTASSLPSGTLQMCNPHEGWTSNV